MGHLVFPGESDLMKTYPNIISAIGNTPLVKLNKIVPEGAATILAKCEFLNPTSHSAPGQQQR